MAITSRLTEGVRTALASAKLPSIDECVWGVPRQTEHGDYATNVAMLLARTAKSVGRAAGARREPRRRREIGSAHDRAVIAPTRAIVASSRWFFFGRRARRRYHEFIAADVRRFVSVSAVE